MPIDERGHQPGLRRVDRGQEGDQGGAGDEHDLVGDALDREGGVPLGVGVEQVGPAAADQGADRRDRRPATAASRCGQGSAQSSVIETIIRPSVEREQHGVDVQHPRLSEPVDQPALRDRRTRRCR